MYYLTKLNQNIKKFIADSAKINIRSITLHFIYIHVIEHVSYIVKPILVADDTSLFRSHTCVITLIQKLNSQLHNYSTV